MCFADRFQWTCTRMAAGPASRRKRRRAATSRMRCAGSLAVACLADVPDMPVLGRSAEGALAMVRAPAGGELYHHHLDRLAWMDELVAPHCVRRAPFAA